MYATSVIIIVWMVLTVAWDKGRTTGIVVVHSALRYSKVWSAQRDMCR